MCGTIHPRPPAGTARAAARLASALLLTAASWSARDLAAQRAPNIDPATSRPPVLLSLPPAEANRQVRELALMTLIQALQTGDADLVEAVAGDLLIEDAPGGRCKSLRDGMNAVRLAHAAEVQDEGGRLPIYPDAITQRDSADVTVLELDLLVAPKAKAGVKNRARLTYDNAQAKWRGSKGLLKALCAAEGSTK